jgi:glycogen debranching enzyme
MTLVERMHRPNGRVMGDTVPVDLPQLSEQFTLVSPSRLTPIITGAADKLVTPMGILASSSEEAFGRVFGRDTLITQLVLRAARQRFGKNYVSPNVLARAGFPLMDNVAQRDDPRQGVWEGQELHEMGTSEQGFPSDWDSSSNVDGTKVNYDTVDATPLSIIVAKQMLDAFPTDPEVQAKYNKIEPMTRWAINNMSRHGGLIGYTGAEYDEVRASAGVKGLRNHTWQDCANSIVDAHGEIPKHPIKPVAEQAMTWVALLEAADFLRMRDPHLSLQAQEAADRLKQTFNDRFIYRDERGGSYLARAIDGKDQQVQAVNIDVLATLGYTYKGESIVTDERVIDDVIRRSMRELYTPLGGLRTQSPLNIVHPNGIYHGPTSFWPHANILAVMGLLSAADRIRERNPLVAEEYTKHALDVTAVTMGMIVYFGSPVETFHIFPDGTVDLFRTKRPDGSIQTSALTQAWAWAAAIFGQGLLEAYNRDIMVPQSVRGRSEDLRNGRDVAFMSAIG